MSPRKKKTRNCTCPLRGNVGVGRVFNPGSTPLREMEIITLERDELEAFYLCDGQDLHQERAGEMMGVSRGTVQRLLAGARKKMVEVLVGQKTLVIVGDMPTVQVQSPDVAPPIHIGHEEDVVVQESSSCANDEPSSRLGISRVGV